MLDIGGFITSINFVSQIAAIVAAILTALVGDVIAALFAVT